MSFLSMELKDSIFETQKEKKNTNVSSLRYNLCKKIIKKKAKSPDERLSRLSLHGWNKGLMQKAVLLDTARIVRRFLSLQP